MKIESKNKAKTVIQPKFKFGELVFFLYEDTIKQGYITEITLNGDIENYDPKATSYRYSILHRKCPDSRFQTYATNECDVASSPDEVKKNIPIKLHHKERGE